MNSKRNTYNEKSFNYIFDNQLNIPNNNGSLPIFENYPKNTRINENNNINTNQNYQSLPSAKAMPINGSQIPDFSLLNPVSTRNNFDSDKNKY